MLIHLEIIILIISGAKIDPLAQAWRLIFGLDRAYTFLWDIVTFANVYSTQSFRNY